MNRYNRNRMQSRKELIGSVWKKLNKLGSGVHGQVFKGVNVNNSHKKAAIKMEKKRPGHTPFLQSEYEFYKKAKNRYAGFPRFYCYGDNDSGTHKALVMSRLGPSLQDLSSGCNRKLSTKTVLMIALQGVRRIKCIHDLGFVHGDIKPANMLIGRYDRDRIYVVDFGLAKRFRTNDFSAYRSQIPYRTAHDVAGTIRYASLNAHKGYDFSRSDDLESFGYSLVELFKGYLPWSRSSGKNNTRQSKEQNSISKLCEGLPSAMSHYFKHIRGLSFGERPDYHFLEYLFRKALERRGLRDDRRFDWI